MQSKVGEQDPRLVAFGERACVADFELEGKYAGQLGLKQCFSSAPCLIVILCRRTLANLTVVTGYRVHVVKRIIP